MATTKRRARAGALVRGAALGALGLALLATGTAHLSVRRQEFRAQVPAWFPVEADLVVVVSGVVELVLGAGLILSLLAGRRARVLAGLLSAAFFVAIVPGNLAQYLEGTAAFGLDSDRARLLRLLFQPVLVAWALWSSGAWSWLSRWVLGRDGGRVSARGADR